MLLASTSRSLSSQILQFLYRCISYYAQWEWRSWKDCGKWEHSMLCGCWVREATGCHLPAKFKIVSVEETLILLFSCVFFSLKFFFFRIQFQVIDQSFFLLKILCSQWAVRHFLASKPFIEHVQRIPLIKKISFFPLSLRSSDVYILPEAQVHPRRAL